MRVVRFVALLLALSVWIPLLYADLQLRRYRDAWLSEPHNAKNFAILSIATDQGARLQFYGNDEHGFFRIRFTPAPLMIRGNGSDEGWQIVTPLK